MILLRDRLAELLHEQYNPNTSYSDCTPEEMFVWIRRANEIIQFFVDAIKNEEFKIT